MASSLEGVPDTLLNALTPELSSLVDDVIAIIFERDPTRFLKAHYVPVNGTNESLVAFEFDGEAFRFMFDLEFRAALRARGFELPRRSDASVSHVTAS